MILGKRYSYLTQRKKIFSDREACVLQRFTLADEKLYVLYSESDLESSPPLLVSELNGMFGKINTKAQDTGLDFYYYFFQDSLL